MALTNLVLADDFSNTSSQGRNRSKLSRQLASHLSEILKAHLHIIYVEDTPEFHFDGSLLNLVDPIHACQLDDLKQTIEETTGNTNIHLEIAMGSPAEKILEYANSTSSKLIVTGTRGLRGPGKLFLGSVTEEVARNSQIPVFVIGPTVKRISFSCRQEHPRILLLTDLSWTSKNAENYTKKLAKQTNAEVTILHSVGEPIHKLKQLVYRSRVPIFSLDERVAEMKKWAYENLNRCKEKFTEDNILVQIILLHKEHDFLIDFKKELKNGYDLVIIGTHGRTKTMTSFLGSTARKACLVSSTPVAIVPSKSNNISSS
ncbi:hypothetical protein BDW_10355 [Bdellovibrio bacteriovorus W]|nr:hypothetical protein BDW_10355 [Bdellovibrio bacteriovorus W]